MQDTDRLQAPSSAQMLLLSTGVIIALAASSAVLYGTPEQSERGLKLLNWVGSLRDWVRPAAEPDS